MVTRLVPLCLRVEQQVAGDEGAVSTRRGVTIRPGVGTFLERPGAHPLLNRRGEVLAGTGGGGVA